MEQDKGDGKLEQQNYI